MTSFSECEGFEAEWKQRNVENVTVIKVPVRYGTAIPIKCVGGYGKLSGPDVVTCLDDTTFAGLDNIRCCSEY